MSVPTLDATRRRVRLGTVGLGVAVAALSTAVVFEVGVLTDTSRRAVEATAAAYGTTPEIVFVTVHAPLLLGVLMGAVGSVYVGLLLPGGVGEPDTAAADTASVGAALRLSARAGVLATGVALGVPLLAVGGGAFPASLLLAFVAGLPLGVLALCGATVGTALAGWTGRREATLLGTVAPGAGLVLVHVTPAGPVWTAAAGATFTALALVGGGWSFLAAERS